MSESTTLVATNPAEMATAQHGLIDWCDEKLKECQSDLTCAQGIVAALRKAGISDARGRRAVTAARRRMGFYAKVKGALEAGYYILPPFPVEIFAIRIKPDALPATDHSTSNYRQQQTPDAGLPPGEGEYVNPYPQRLHVDTVEKKNSNGSTYQQHYYENAEEWRKVEFPVAVVKPQLIEATGKALALKVFDKLGLFRRQKDPIIVGQIVHYKKFHDPLTFFVAWWVDTKDI